jgi:TolA-binding protein
VVLNKELETVKFESANRHRIGLNWKNRVEKDRQARDEVVAEKDKQIEDLNKQIEELKGEIETSKTKIAELEKKLGDTEKGNHAKDMTVQRLQSELTKAHAGGAGAQSGAKQVAVPLPVGDDPALVS